MQDDKISKYIIENPFCLMHYTPLVDASLHTAFQCGDCDVIHKFYMQEYERVKQIYIQIGNPRTAIVYAQLGCKLLTEVTIFDSAIAIFLSYVAELCLACGQVDLLVGSLLEQAENHASKSPCESDIRIRMLANIYLLRSIAEKALGKQSEALHLLSVLNNDNWVKKNEKRYLLISIHRQRVMMEQSFQAHMDLLKIAVKIKNVAPLEYYRTIKRVFEFATNNGYLDSVKRLMPFLLCAFVDIQNQVPVLSKISLLKNLGQANGLLGNYLLAKNQLDCALDIALNKELKGQVVQINHILQGIDRKDVVGTLSTFRVK